MGDELDDIEGAEKFIAKRISEYNLLVGEGDGDVIQLEVLVSDTFSYATADFEVLRYSDYGRYQRLVEKFPKWGDVIWVCLVRKCRPITPVEEKMRKAGEWMDELDEFESYAARIERRQKESD